MSPPMKLIAKTNRIGLFQNPNKEMMKLLRSGKTCATQEFNIHIDSSHRALDYNHDAGEHIYTTGFLMKSLVNKVQSYSSGGSIRYHAEKLGSHVFELEGILDTLRTVSDYFRKNRHGVKLNVFTDNITVVHAYRTFVINGNTKTPASKVLRSILEENKELLERFELEFKWEKGHSSNNLANRFADSIATYLRHEGTRYDNLTPLQMCGVLSRVSRVTNQSVYDNLMNDYILRTFTGVEKSTVLQILSTSSPRKFIYKFYSRGSSKSKFTEIVADSVYQAMNMALESYTQTPNFKGIWNKVYLVGSGFDGVEMFVREYYKEVDNAKSRELQRFYSYTDILFDEVILLGGCCSNEKMEGPYQTRKHKSFIALCDEWNAYRDLISNHNNKWSHFEQFKFSST